jgi:hypothetical protein
MGAVLGRKVEQPPYAVLMLALETYQALAWIARWIAIDQRVARLTEEHQVFQRVDIAWPNSVTTPRAALAEGDYVRLLAEVTLVLG